MNTLILMGGGGHCVSVLDTVYQIGHYDRIIILDTSEKKGMAVLDNEVTGSDEMLPQLYKQGCRDIFITVGSIKNTQIRHKLAKKVVKEGFRLINIIDPSACVSKRTNLGEGIFVGKKAIINAGSSISDMAIINSGAVIEHNNYIGEYSHLAVGSVLCGDVSIGSDCLIGANATVLQGLSIGDGCIIGAGSLIFKDVPPMSKVYGGTRQRN